MSNMVYENNCPWYVLKHIMLKVTVLPHEIITPPVSVLNNKGF